MVKPLVTSLVFIIHQWLHWLLRLRLDSKVIPLVSLFRFIKIDAKQPSIVSFESIFARFSTIVNCRETKIPPLKILFYEIFIVAVSLIIFLSPLLFSLLHLDLYRKIHGRRLDPWKQGFAQVQETAGVSQLWTLCRNTWYLKYGPKLAWKVVPIASSLICPTATSKTSSIKLELKFELSCWLN